MGILEKRRAAEIAILHRVAPKVFNDGLPSLDLMAYRSMSLIEIGKELLKERGVNTAGKDKYAIASILMGGLRNMATSDFPLLLEDVANKIIRNPYGLAPESWPKIARRTIVTNFKDQRLFQVGSANGMQEIPEGDEIKYGKLVEAQQKIRAVSYGEGLKFTHQMLVNDDLGAFETIPAKFVRDWNLKRGDLVWGMIKDNIVMYDGKPFFCPEHKNLSPNPANLSEESLEEALVAFKSQTDIDGKTKIRVSPKFITVSPEQEVTARKLLTIIHPNKSSDVNIFATFGLELIVEPRLTGMEWYMSAEPLAIDGLYYATLDGEEDLRANMEGKFSTDSIDYAVRGSFGVAAIDYCGWYKNPGL